MLLGALTVRCSDSQREGAVFVSFCFGECCSVSPARGNKCESFVSGVRGVCRDVTGPLPDPASDCLEADSDVRALNRLYYCCAKVH